MYAFAEVDDAIRIGLEMDAPTRNDNLGTFQSVLDLEGADMIISISTPPLPPPENPKMRRERVVGFKPDVFLLELRNGRKIDVPVDWLHEGRFAPRVDKSFKAKIALKQELHD